ncbi:MAG TPA: hypothetical protein VHE23_05765 [Candidatus Acidoferrales bacterium]|nr:hypothetical protein [Candidatus Acidoferrales bacterium]
MSLPAQEQSSGQKPPDPEKSSTEQKSPPVVSVDSARKSSDLATSGTTENNLGLEAGVYEVKQSFELGGRLSDFTGSRAMWDTFVNLGTGPRLLEYTLDLRAPKHDGLLFDNLSFSNYGYGGDPNNVTRLRANKGKYYNLNASFRRDQNIFDYDLLANPLNPATSNPNVPILDSPHEFLLTRRMADVNVTLLPLSKIRFRLGYSRVTTQGTTFSSVHEGTEGLLFQPTSNITDNYQFGVSLRFIPRTSINYDQFYSYYKGDTTAGLSSFGFPSFTLAGGIPVNLGIPFNTVAGQPCATPVLGTGFANPACNGYFSYNRSGPTRTSFPTEQFSLQSNYFRRVDFSARINYSQAENDMPNYGETFNGLITRTRGRSFAITGGSLTHRISLAGDFGISLRVTDKLRIVDTFRYDNFRIPGNFAFTTASLFGATLLSNPNVFTPATCPPPFTAATCPQHSASSGADIVNDASTVFLRQEEKVNTIELEYDFTRRFSAHLGYRFSRRSVTHAKDDVQFQTFFPTLPNRGACAGLPLSAGVCTTTVEAGDSDTKEINGHALVFGFSARPIDHLRIIFDTDIQYYDATLTRISPRQMQQYRLRTTYQPLNWVSFGGAITIFENRNNTADIGNLQHNRSYAFNTTVAPAEGKWGFDLSYDYNDIFSQTNICYVATPTPPGALTCGAPFLSGLSFYTNTSNFASGSFFLKPISRVTVAAGYAVTSTTGNTLILDQLSPTGPLSYNYHLPTASLAIQLTKHLLYKTGWNYYDYNEKSAPGPTLPRDFRGNTFTLSMRYTM